MKRPEREAQHNIWLVWNADRIDPSYSYNAQTSNLFIDIQR
jgi:hypothetical protein